MVAVKSVLTRASGVPTLYPRTSRNTVVALLGWANGRDDNLAKYSRIYEKRGYTTLRFISQFVGHTRSLMYSRNVSGVIDNIREVLSESDKQLSMHIFSMNGIYTLCSLLLQHPDLNILDRTSGIVFDSCPICFDEASANAFGDLADVFAAKILQSGHLTEIVKYRLWKAYFILNVRIALYELGSFNVSAYILIVNVI
uniref:AB hydrolase-1 domain-containing protein n=1 Tax=Heterorhabditis bacteriophora TaxID=37862 RepID=A0A1I7WVC7_HETBA